jgi:transcriptional regulator GlxA family with amidase domain
VPNYRLLVCAAEPGLLRTEAGFSIRAQYTLRELDQADTIVVPAWRDIHERPPERLLAALRRAHRRGARIASLCSGAFVLAAAGLLDGKRATTHWMYADMLARNFSAIRVDPAVLYVDEGSVLTSAGTAAGIDLCLHMVRLDHGAEVANIYARRMVVPPHRDGGQAQYVEAPMPRSAEDQTFGATLDWAMSHLDQRITVARLASHAHSSPRTFARRFLASTGTTPLRWLLGQRVIAARRLLETSELPVDQVAELCGFGSAASMRLHFSRLVGNNPTAYRRTFRQSIGEMQLGKTA